MNHPWAWLPFWLNKFLKSFKRSTRLERVFSWLNRTPRWHYLLPAVHTFSRQAMLSSKGRQKMSWRILLLSKPTWVVKKDWRSDMTTFKKILFFFILPIIGTMIYQPSILGGAFSVIGVAVVFLILLGYLLLRGYSRALTFMIFLNGMNVVIRIMMVLSTSFNKNGVFNLSFTLYGIAGILISLFLLLRLDKIDIRQTMIR